ncbi:PP2C family protein-serine/threonine phosphatase [Patescibacteria group bacterium]|nr:PP2C family protein-serine/threonine phosphatase [Patescibacteria group bacterium]MBU1682576.1 PP2C family protein-serine/threonine phosphatase [Patescibacteria group bacterium]MBU1935733.1 PP2C family protein-serine/threonine phosphatase [Patescibacteria group bacterium]
MKFIRENLINKAFLLFTVLVAAVVTVGIVLNRMQVSSISLNLFLAVSVLVLAFILIVFILDVIIPLNRVIKQVTNLLTGKNYKKVNPITIDEIGVMTHFFNEITTDLEKISYDIKERRRMSSELDIASKIQQDVLPKEAPETPGLDIVAKTRSAAEVGGDTFDFLMSPDKNQLFVYIGDVTGHGVPAGLIMMMVDTLVTAMVSQGVSNGRDLIVNTNNLLTPRISSRLFMTSVMLRWDKQAQKMYYTGAGHEHILVYRTKTEIVETIRSGGIALGMIPNVAQIVQEKEIPLEIGDTIVLYSDGITEAKDKIGNMYELDKLTASLKRHGYRPSAESIFDNLTKDFSNFVGEYVQVDDITMIVIKYLGKDSATSKVKLEVSVDESQAERKSKLWGWS